jgi:hypothetical protein
LRGIEGVSIPSKSKFPPIRINPLQSIWIENNRTRPKVFRKRVAYSKVLGLQNRDGAELERRPSHSRWSILLSFCKPSQALLIAANFIQSVLVKTMEIILVIVDVFSH